MAVKRLESRIDELEKELLERDLKTFQHFQSKLQQEKREQFNT